MNKKVCISLQIGLFLINLIFFTLVISTVLLLVNIPIRSINLLVSILCSIIVCYFISKKNIRQTTITTLVSLFVLLLTVIICSHSYDFSWDGNTYHKTMAGFMTYGWNPLYESFYDFAESKFSSWASVLTQTWLDAYPKGSEMWAACIYAITGNIETGKCFNLLSAIALSFISYTFFSETALLKKWQSFVCALLCAFHPVAFSQFFTFYNDGFLWQFFLLCIFCLSYLTLYKKGSLFNLCCYMLFISIAIGLNIKFSALIYFGLPCIIFFLYWGCVAWKTKLFITKKSILTKRFLLLASATVFGICFVGSTSYVINTIRHKNPVYTMIGEGSTELVTVQLPTVYQNMSNWSRFISSLFSETNGSKAIEQIEWKLPFSYHEGEFFAAQSCDVRTAGWGILFSGIFTISLIVIFYALIRHRKTQKELCSLTKLLFAIMILSIIIIPGLSWARYFAALFYIPVIAITYLFIRFNKLPNKRIFNLVLSGALALLLCLNMIPNAYHAHQTLAKDYPIIHEQLGDFRTLTQKQNVLLGYNSRGRFSGRLFTLFDMNITNFNFTELSEDDTVQNLFPYYGLIYKVDESTGE